VTLQGTNRLGRAVKVTIEGEALAKHLHRRARKGALVAPRSRSPVSCATLERWKFPTAEIGSAGLAGNT
jgi:hypothetical protein